MNEKDRILAHKVLREISGGALPSQTLQGLLKASYDKKIKNVDGYELDSRISSNTTKVYYNPILGKAVIAHMGTKGVTDWGNNAVYGLFGKTGYKLTPRYREAEKVQKAAEKKYGKNNVITIGHSQGGLQAELLGQNSNEIITLNKATRPLNNSVNSNQTDISTSKDLVSSLNPFQRKNGKEIVLKTNSNPLDAHNIENLDQLDGDVGSGLKRRRLVI
jgi:hypothetical protein